MPPIDNDNEIFDSIFRNSVCRLFSNVESLSTSYVSKYIFIYISEPKYQLNYLLTQSL